MSNVSANAGKKIAGWYLAAVVCMGLMVLFLLIEQRGYRVDFGLEGYRNIEDLLTLENGEPAKLTELEAYADPETGRVSVFYRVPELWQDTGLVYRSQNVFTTVLLEGRSLYETDVEENSLYHREPGSRWNIVTLDSSMSGQTLELQITPAYEGEKPQIDHVYWGDEAAIVLGVIKGKLPAVVISLLTGLLGVFLVAADIPVNYKNENKNHNLRYLGLFSVIMGIWSLIETNILQFFVGDVRMLQVVDNMLLVLAVMPLFLYADSAYRILRFPIIRVLCWIDLLYLAACILLPVSGIMDWHQMLPFVRGYLAVCAVVFIVWTIQQSIALQRQHDEKKCIYGRVQLIGIGIMGLSLMAELVRFSCFGGMDKALLFRIGLLGFVICFGMSSQMDTYKLIEQGREYDFVRTLAYSDGLTGAGNRTAYLEQLENYVKERVPQLGIVFLDINNLKKVNDGQGHDAGDELIRAAAGVIQDSFGTFGKVFRIGGDEFCVLIAHKNARWMYEEAMKVFRRCLREANESNSYPFVLQIAQGFACCEVSGMEVVEETVKKADELMYQHKAELKAKSGNQT